MAYDKGLVRIDRLRGGALTGWSMITGVGLTGESAYTREAVDFASVSISDGYTVEDNGTLSLDPATGTATISDHVELRPGGDPSFGAGPFGLGRFGMAYGGLELPPINRDDRVEVFYDGTLILAGLWTQVDVTFNPDPKAPPPKFVQRTITATLASVQRLLLNTRVEWLSLPAEPAITRLRRWFDVDTSAVPDPAVLNVLVAGEPDPGSTTLLDVARAFTAATALPVRPPAVVTPDNWPSLEVVVLTDDPPAGLTDAADWATELKYTDGRPTALAVKSDDIRFAIERDSHEIGGFTTLTAFRVPGRVDAFGRVVTVYRLAQTYAKSYSADLEVVV